MIRTHPQHLCKDSGFTVQDLAHNTSAKEDRMGCGTWRALEVNSHNSAAAQRGRLATEGQPLRALPDLQRLEAIANSIRMEADVGQQPDQDLPVDHVVFCH